MQRARLVRTLLVTIILAATAACAGDTVAPTEPGTGCKGEAPEPGMVCRGDIWGWN